MKPLAYHAGQLAAQGEAGTKRVAEKLADWVGPVPDFARGADLIVLATPDPAGELRFTVVSGSAPLVQIAGVMTCAIARAERLRGLAHPRERIARAPRVTSRSTVPEQKPR